MTVVALPSKSGSNREFWNESSGLAEKRAEDLIRALAGPHLSEGMLEMRVFLGKKGLSLATPGVGRGDTEYVYGYVRQK